MILLINDNFTKQWSIFLLSYIKYFWKEIYRIFIYIAFMENTLYTEELGVNKKRISNLKTRAVIKSSSFLT